MPILLDSKFQNPKNVSSFIVLLSKQYIYKVRCLKDKLSINVFKSYIYQVRNLEKYNAMKNSTLNKFNAKWLGINVETITDEVSDFLLMIT